MSEKTPTILRSTENVTSRFSENTGRNGLHFQKFIREVTFSPVLKARTCYGHLGGTLGGRLFERMLELGWFERDGDKATVYSLTENGKQAFLELGIDIYERR